MNNFIYTVTDCYKRKPVLVTFSPSKAKSKLEKGFRIDISHKEKIIQTVYYKDIWIMNAYIEMQENTADKLKAKAKVESHINELSTQQYKVLIGLINNGEINGAIKGLHKILRRNKAH